MSRVTYELVSSCSKDNLNQVISVSTTGQISSHSASGTATVLVTVHEDFGFNQTALIEVEVSYNYTLSDVNFHDENLEQIVLLFFFPLVTRGKTRNCMVEYL